MANYETLKSAIQQVVKTNGNNEITGALLQQSLLAMINSLGSGYQFAGIANPKTNPGTIDQKAFYLAATAGTYENFGRLELDDKLTILKYDTQWVAESLDIPTKSELSQLEDLVNLASIILQSNNAFRSTINQSYISSSTKEPASDTSSKRTDFIPVSGYDKVVGVGGFYTTGYVVAFYDSAYNFIENGSIRGKASVTNDLRKSFIYDIPQNAQYVIMSQYNPQLNDLGQFITLVNSQLFSNVFGNGLENRANIQELASKTEDYQLNLDGVNVYDGKPSLPGYILTTGKINSDNNARLTPYFKIKNGDKIAYNVNMGNGGVAVAFFDENKTLLTGTGHQSILDTNTQPHITGELIVNDDSAKYVVISSYSMFSTMYYRILPANSKYADLYEKIGQLPTAGDVDLLPTINDNPLRIINEYPGFAALFKDWGFIGDSMSSATFNTRSGGNTQYDYSWPQYLCRLCGVSGYNFTIPGITTKTWLASSDQRGWGGCSANPKKSYIIALGCNDADSGASYYLPVGNIATDVNFEDFRNNNGDTFAGNYAGIIQRIKSISPQAKIFCVTLPQGDRSLANNYNAIIRDLVTKFDNVFLIDLWTYAKPVNGVWAQKYREGYHLNTAGYLYTAFEMMTYIDWHVKNNPFAFRDVGLIGVNQQMTGQYKVYGTITNGENAFISIVNDNVKAYITADGSGNYSYLWLPSGTYNIYVQKDGQTTYRGSFTISNADIQKNITL